MFSWALIFVDKLKITVLRIIPTIHISLEIAIQRSLTSNSVNQLNNEICQNLFSINVNEKTVSKVRWLFGNF